MALKKILFDTNIILDWLLERDQFYEASTYCIQQCLKKKVQGYLTPHSISDLFYIMRKEKGVKESKEFIRLLANIFFIMTENEDTINYMNKSDLWNDDSWNDVEDAMQMVSAELCRMDLILSRNSKDFNESPVICMTPEEFCRFI